MADYLPNATQQPESTGALDGWKTAVGARYGSVPRFTEELKLPPALEAAFRNFWQGIVGDNTSLGFTPALVTFSQTWLWLKSSPDPEARKLREMFGRVYMKECQQPASDSYGIGAAVAGAKAMASDTRATSESQLGRRELELLEGLRENQQKMQMAASESDAIRRLRTLVAPGNLEEVLQLARRITLG